MMNYPEKPKNIDNSSFSGEDIHDLPQKYIEYAGCIGESSYKPKRVHTVLITLLVHKFLFPQQNSRKYQSSMQDGFAIALRQDLYLPNLQTAVKLRQQSR